MTDVVGARCAVHPAREASGTCDRCGNFVCPECTAGGGTVTTCVTCAEEAAESRYHVVPRWRFVLFSALTWGVYSVWWFMRNWAAVQRSDRSDIWPIPRAVFGGFTYFMLVEDINAHLGARGRKELSMVFPLGFLAASATYRLPDPYSIASAFAFVFLLPAVRAIDELASRTAREAGGVWRLRHTLLMVAAVPFFLVAALSMMLPEDSLD